MRTESPGATTRASDAGSRSHPRRPPRLLRRRPGMVASSALLSGLLVPELGLRGLGRAPLPGPATPDAIPSAQSPMILPHPVLGTALQAGSYVQGDGVRVTIHGSGRRMSGRAPERPEGKAILLGGSFTHGQAVSDPDTFASKLQTRHPSIEFHNYGSPGHGTYQALLRYEALRRLGERADLVLYGFIQSHEGRNVRDGARRTKLLEDQSRWGTVLRAQNVPSLRRPFCELTSRGELVRRMFVAPDPWPMARRSALVGSIQRSLLGRSGERDPERRRSVTRSVLRELGDLVRRDGGDLIVVHLSTAASVQEEYGRFLGSIGVQSLDCSFPLEDDMIVPGDGHPNGLMHTRYADCIDAVLAARFETIDHGWSEEPAPATGVDESIADLDGRVRKSTLVPDDEDDDSSLLPSIASSGPGRSRT